MTREVCPEGRPLTEDPYDESLSWGFACQCFDRMGVLPTLKKEALYLIRGSRLGVTDDSDFQPLDALLPISVGNRAVA